MAYHGVMAELDVYTLIGDEGFERLISAFYKRIPGDSILGPMYAQSVGPNMAEAERRLRLFLVGRFNGPPVYIKERGHPRLRMRHVGFKIDAAAAERWLHLMGEALKETALPAEVEPILRQYFADAAAHMINQA